MTVYSAEWKNEIRLWLLLKHVRDLNLTLRVVKSLWRFLMKTEGQEHKIYLEVVIWFLRKNAIMVVRDLVSISDPSKPTVALWKSHFPLWVGVSPTLNYDILYTVSIVFQPYSYRILWLSHGAAMTSKWKYSHLEGGRKVVKTRGNKINSQSSGSKQNSGGLKKLVKPRKSPPQCHKQSQLLTRGGCAGNSKGAAYE